MQNRKLFAGSFLTALFVLPALCPAQTISIVSGNGQLLCPNCPENAQTFAPLVVQVNNFSGTPAEGVTVTWTPTQQGSTLAPSTSITNAQGQTSYILPGQAFFYSLNSYLASTVVASLSAPSTASVTFIETSVLPTNGGGPAVFASLANTNGIPPNLSGAVGTTAAVNITVYVQPYTGEPVPGVAIALETGTTGPGVTCAPQAGQPAGAQPGVILTNSDGIAVCTPLFGGAAGKGTYNISVGGVVGAFEPASLTVTAGKPAAVKYISGNNQSVSPGVKTYFPLVAEVTDVGGNASVGAAVTWSVTAGTATLSNEITSSSSTGQVSTYVTPTVGPVTVLLSLVGTSAQYAFTVNVTTIVTTLTYDSGTGQTAKEGAAFADPLMVTVFDNGVPVPGATVDFAVTGPATLSASSATSNTLGQASITATASATTYGSVVVTASIASTACAGGTCSYAFNLTVVPNGPVITSVVNAAGFAQSPLAASPCSLVTIYGIGLADGLQGVVASFIAPQTQVFGVSVQFGGQSAPILDVANVNGVESVSAQVPCGVQASTANPPATVPMVVTVDGSASSAFQVPVTTYSPGLFQFLDSDGQTRGVVIRPDGSFASVSNPIARGEIGRMFVTGLGQTSPTLGTDEFDPLVEVDGNWIPQDLSVLADIVVGLNNGGILVVSAKYAYGMVGVYEVDFQVPQDTATGSNAPFAIAVSVDGQLLFGNGSQIAIQ